MLLFDSQQSNVSMNKASAFDSSLLGLDKDGGRLGGLRQPRFRLLIVNTSFHQ